MEELLRYFEVTCIAFILNIIPAFVPPTWIALSLYGINHPELNNVVLAFFGVIGSVAGRSIMYLYSKVLGKYIPKKYVENNNPFKKFIEEKKLGLFLGSSIYSVGPFPSNFLFISSGISNMKIFPVIAGFAFGRAISYTSLIYASYKAIFLLKVFGLENIKLLADILGVLAAVSIFFIDWRKIHNNLRKIIRRVRTLTEFGDTS